MEGTAPSGGKGKWLRAAWARRATQQQIMNWFHDTNQACVPLAVSQVRHFRPDPHQGSDPLTAWSNPAGLRTHNLRGRPS